LWGRESKRTFRMPELEIRTATEGDVPLILSLIKELAEYERLSHEVSATEETLRDSLIGERAAAEVLIGECEGQPAAFALFFHNFSTFLGRPGIYLEDLYVTRVPGPGSGEGNAGPPGEAGEEAWLRAARVVGAGLERARDKVL
jgi:hypothetical protein